MQSAAAVECRYEIVDTSHHGSSSGSAAAVVAIDDAYAYRKLINCSTSNASMTSSTESAVATAVLNATLRYNIAHLLVTSLLLGVIILTTIIGNVFVIAAIVLERNLHNVANYLIASLAVADLMVAALVMPLAAVNEVSSAWFLGREACDAFVSFDVLCCTASILHLVAISLDRYWAVTRVDYIHNRSARLMLTMIAASWIVSALITFPPLFGSRNPLFDPDVTGICLISQDWGYTVFSTIGAFYLPLFAMIIIYARVYRAARSRIRKRTFRRQGAGAASVLLAASSVASSRAKDADSQGSQTPQPLLRRSFFRSDTNGAEDTEIDAAAVAEELATSTANGRAYVDERNVEDRTQFSPAVAVGNACTIIIAAAAATSPAAAVDRDLPPETPPTASSTDCPSTSSPFFARFLDGSWLAMAARHNPRRWRHRSDDDSTSLEAAAVGRPLTGAAASRRAREKQEQKRERKAARTLAIVTGTFVVCWLPFFILALVRPFCGDRCHYPPLLVSVIGWLGYFNSLLNPVIYTIFNPDFRSAFRKILFGKYRGHQSQMHALQHLPFVRR